MKKHVVGCACCSLLLLACSSRSDRASAPGPRSLVTNQGLAAEWIVGDGALRLVVASEEDQGRDLDGDGDAFDSVVELLDLERGTLVDAGLALTRGLPRGGLPPPSVLGVSDALAVFEVSEPETGRDVDGDDTLEFELAMVFDRRTGRLEAQPFPCSSAVLGGELAALLCPEASMVLRVLDARDGSLTTVPGAPRAVPAVRDGLVAYVLSEDGLADLNTDGDASDDAVLHFYDAARRRSVNTGWATEPDVRIAGGCLGARVPESAQGGADLDGDGFALNDVFVAVDSASGRTLVPDLRVHEPADVEQRDPTRFLLTVRERPGEDRNGDGDSHDRVVVVYDPRTGAVQDTRLATRTSALSAGRWIGVRVYEAAQGDVDLDRDGETNSDVVHVFDTETGTAQDLGFEAELLGALDGHLLLLRSELGGDWNDDGDRDDRVLFDWNARTRALRNTRFAVDGFAGALGETALVSVSERAQGADLDADGDREDLVLALYDGGTGQMRGLGLATDGRSVHLGAHGAAVLVPEQSQGVDLNGDGDLLDRVLHTLALDG